MNICQHTQWVYFLLHKMNTNPELKEKSQNKQTNNNEEKFKKMFYKITISKPWTPWFMTGSTFFLLTAPTAGDPAAFLIFPLHPILPLYWTQLWHFSIRLQRQKIVQIVMVTATKQQGTRHSSLAAHYLECRLTPPIKLEGHGILLCVCLTCLLRM